MNKLDTLIGRNVRLFIENDYELDGKLELLDEEKAIINSNGSYYLIFKSKIYMVLLNPEEVLPPEPVKKISANEELVRNYSYENAGGYGLPNELLKERSNFEDLLEPKYQQDFSISHQSMKNQELIARQNGPQNELLNRARRKLRGDTE